MNKRLLAEVFGDIQQLYISGRHLAKSVSILKLAVNYLFLHFAQDEEKKF